MKKLVVLALASVLTVALTTETFSKSFSSRSYSSSRSSFSFKSSTPKYTRTKVVVSKSTRPKAVKTKTSGSMSKFNKSKKVTTTMKNRINNQIAKKDYKQYTNKFKKKNTTKKVYKPTKSDSNVLTSARSYDKNTYHTRRSNYYNNRTYDPYVYNYSPSYGMYDSRALWSMRDPYFFYNYNSTPGVSLFLADMLIESHRNAEVKRQLDAINLKMSQLKSEGTRVNQSYKPSGIDLDVMLIPEVAENNKSTLRLCTGSTDGTYASVGRALNRNIKNVKISLVGSSGSIDNLNKMEENKCDAAFVQRDSYKQYLSKVDSKLQLQKMFRMYNEYAQLVCTRESGIDSFNDLTSNDVVLTGPIGSGSAITWGNVNSKAKTKKVTSMTEGMALLLEDDAQCAFNVTSLKSNLMTKTENKYGEFFKLVDIEIPEYTTAVIDDDNYDNLTEGMFYISWDVDTVTIPMDLVVKEDWIKVNKMSYASSMSELVDVVPAIRKATNSK